MNDLLKIDKFQTLARVKNVILQTNNITLLVAPVRLVNADTWCHLN